MARWPSALVAPKKTLQPEIPWPMERQGWQYRCQDPRWQLKPSSLSTTTIDSSICGHQPPCIFSLCCFKCRPLPGPWDRTLLSEMALFCTLAYTSQTDTRPSLGTSGWAGLRPTWSNPNFWMHKSLQIKPKFHPGLRSLGHAQRRNTSPRPWPPAIAGWANLSNPSLHCPKDHPAALGGSAIVGAPGATGAAAVGTGVFPRNLSWHRITPGLRACGWMMCQGVGCIAKLSWNPRNCCCCFSKAFAKAATGLKFLGHPGVSEQPHAIFRFGLFFARNGIAKERAWQVINRDIWVYTSALAMQLSRHDQLTAKVRLRVGLLLEHLASVSSQRAHMLVSRWYYTDFSTVRYSKMFGKPGTRYIRQVFKSRAQRSCSQEADRPTSRFKKNTTLDIQINLRSG